MLYKQIKYLKFEIKKINYRNEGNVLKIHPTSIISSKAEIADDVDIGPFCVIKGKVKISMGCVLDNNVTVGSAQGVVEIGRNNYFGPCSVIGGPPQDITYKGEETKLIIGDRNVFREFATVNIATSKSNLITSVGNDNYFMTYTHIGHDCKIGNFVVIANDTHLGGHCLIEDHVKIGGVCCFNQNIRVGCHSFIAGTSVVNKDILPYSKAQGSYAVCRATNKIGLERAKFDNETIEDIHKSMRIILKGNYTMQEALKIIEEKFGNRAEIKYLIDFITSSQRGIAK